MSREFCEREALVVAAARSEVWTAGLEEHAAACAACAETKRIAQLFLEHAAVISSQPQSAHLVWQSLNGRRRQLALRRAAHLMRLMYLLAGAYVLALAAWYMPQLWHGQLVSNLRPLLNGVAFAGVLAAIFAVLLGSCCFAFLGSRADFRLRS